ncbi:MULTISPECIES: carboxypeptidase-like regulatory domain-containing protein [unclassified Flavobacterium]|uniref:carboxypeptidase-like regulatory domain-containing protein n=1 Tax=unclassified Flavobacterium TaxID=196869 RepID=UPI0013149DBF|nr:MULTISPECIES: carboxypeptidase-like regulatory domain-containing protein [unclassified Flavobacterium]
MVLIVSLFTQLIFAQKREVKGIVKDNFGQPLPGANILIEGTKTDTQADFDGNYAIKVNSDQFLVFTYVGMCPEKIIANKAQINVILLQDEPIQEVIAPDVPGNRKKNKAQYLQMMKRISEKDIKITNEAKK